MEKSHVSLDTKICPVTGTKHEVGVLLDRRMKETLERNTITGFQLCPDVQEKVDEGFTVLVEVDHSKSEVMPNGNLNPNGAYRTGTLAYFRNEVFTQMFRMEVPKSHFIYVEKGVIQKLNSMTES